MTDVAWVREQTGIYSDGTLNIRVENHTQVDGAVINSSTGDLTLDTGTLGFSTIKDHDTGSAFSMMVSGNYNTLQDTPYAWNTVQNSTNTQGTGQNGNGGQKSGNDPKTGQPTGSQISGSIENHDREQDTNATIGAGTITIRNQDAQTQDVSILNRDISQAQVITKNESSGVQFYDSSSGAQAIVNPVQFTQQTLAGFERQFDQLAAMGNDGAAILREAARNGTLNADTIKDLKACAGGGGQQGWNLIDLFVTRAHAATGDICGVRTANGAIIPIPKGDAATCYEAVERVMPGYGAEAFIVSDSARQNLKDAALGPLPDERAGESSGTPENRVDMGRQQGLQDIKDGKVDPVAYVMDANGNWQPAANSSGQYLYANPYTGEPQPYATGLTNTITGTTYHPLHDTPQAVYGDALDQEVNARNNHNLETAGGVLLGAVGEFALTTWEASIARRSSTTGSNTFTVDQTIVDDVLAAPKGSRPEPSTYLPEDYINSHLAQFEGGATKISASTPSGNVGPPGGTFVMPSSFADEVISQAGGSIVTLERSLGLEPGALGTTPVRIEISSPNGLRMSSGNERGANSQWLPGGYTSGGVPEATIDAAVPGTYTVTLISSGKPVAPLNQMIIGGTAFNPSSGRKPK